jgi:DNA-binding NtrC family response regulator
MSERLALVIEDDFDASVIFAKALEVIGFTTEVIVSGDKAFDRLKEVEPEMIVLDLHLPEVLGTDILRYIRSEARLAHTKVIVASADPRSAETIQDQADLVLIKPTTFSQVRDFAARLAKSSAKKAAEKSEEQTEDKKEEKNRETTHMAGKQPGIQAASTEPAASAESAAPTSASAEQKGPAQD